MEKNAFCTNLCICNICRNRPRKSQSNVRYNKFFKDESFFNDELDISDYNQDDGLLELMDLHIDNVDDIEENVIDFLLRIH